MSAVPTATRAAANGGLRTRGVCKQTRPGEPLTSVVTVVYNGARHIEQTIQSVLGQSYGNLEYIVVDGGSTDGTVDIIRKYDDRIDFWISERDRGIYDAMNKGLGFAHGEITNLLNADDYYCDPDVVRSVVEHVVARGGESVVVGDTLMTDGAKTALVKCGDLGQGLHYRIPFMHPSCFIPGALYRREGYYDTSYRIAADVDLLMRLMRADVKFEPLGRPCVTMRHGGASNSRFGLGRREYASIYHKHYRNALRAIYGYVTSMTLFYLSSAKRAVTDGKR
jgi:glycosyltransferase involved in cell wall biosynthesis